jgi:hypothetical protein
VEEKKINSLMNNTLHNTQDFEGML